MESWNKIKYPDIIQYKNIYKDKLWINNKLQILDKGFYSANLPISYFEFRNHCFDLSQSFAFVVKTQKNVF